MDVRTEHAGPRPHALVRLHAFMALRRRRQLARTVRKHAQAERARRLRAGVVEPAALASRSALYEEIATFLEDGDRAAAGEGIERIRELLAESPPLADYGPFARARDAQVAALLDRLEGRGTSAE